MKGYQSLRPLDGRIKLPLSEHHNQKMFMYCVDVNKCTSLLPGCATLIGYSLLLRTGEVGHQLRSDEKNFYNKSVTWHPNFVSP